MELEFSDKTYNWKGSDTKVIRTFAEIILSHCDKLRTGGPRGSGRQPVYYC